MKSSLGLKAFTFVCEVNLDSLRTFDQWEFLDCNGHGPSILCVKWPLCSPNFISHSFISILVLGNESPVKEDAILSTFNHEIAPSLWVQSNATFRMRNILGERGRWSYMDITCKEQIGHFDTLDLLTISIDVHSSYVIVWVVLCCIME